MSNRRTFLKQASIAVAAAPFAAVSRQTATVNSTRKLSQTENSKIAKSPWITTLGKQPEYLLYAQLPDGQMMGVHQRTVEGVEEIDARYSTDNGSSWSEPETLFKLPQKKAYDPKRKPWSLENILVDRDGEVHLFFTLLYIVGEAEKEVVAISLYDMRYDVWHVRSTNGRKNWKVPNPVWQEGYAGDMLSVIQLRNGRIVLPLCILTRRTWATPGEGFDAFTDVGRFSSKVTYSDDSGESWHLSPVEFKTSMPYIGADGMIEPAVIQLKDGRVWMLIRTQNGRFYDSFSKDGAEWSHCQPTHIFSSDSPAALVRLKDGRIVMLWNNCLRYPYAQGGRHVIHAAISQDEAQTWRGYREVARDPRVDEPPTRDSDFGVAYTIPAVTKNQEVIFTTGVGQQAPVVVHIDPEWLYETSRRTDFSAGLEDWAHFGTKGVEVVANPEKPGVHALRLRKPEADWPAAAVWNFPMGKRGRLRVKLLLNPGFAGVRLGLTDHFSVPFDPEDQIYNLFDLEIGPNGALASGNKLEPSHWHELIFDWDDTGRGCRVTAEGRPIATLPLTREAAPGVSYFRLTSTADETDKAGLLVEFVDADVSQSWQK